MARPSLDRTICRQNLLVCRSLSLCLSYALRMFVPWPLVCCAHHSNDCDDDGNNYNAAKNWVDRCATTIVSAAPNSLPHSPLDFARHTSSHTCVCVHSHLCFSLVFTCRLSLSLSFSLGRSGSTCAFSCCALASSKECRTKPIPLARISVRIKQTNEIERKELKVCPKS